MTIEQDGARKLTVEEGEALRRALRDSVTIRKVIRRTPPNHRSGDGHE